MTGSVIVVSYKPHRWLSECLRSVCEQADEVIVVDNGSPGTAVADAAAEVDAHLVRLPSNIGFPGGVNAGLRVARGDLVALLNDDAFAGPDWLAVAADVLADPAVGLVAPKLLFAFPHAVVRFDDAPRQVAGEPRTLGRQIFSVTVDGAEVLDQLMGPGIHKVDEVAGSPAADGPSRWRWTSGPLPFFVPLGPAGSDAEILVDGEPVPAGTTVDVINNAGSYLSAHGYGGDYGYGAPDGPPFDAPADRFGACGAAVVTRRDVIERIGPMAAELFAYYEDLDWSWRARLAGYQVRYDPRAVVRHVGGVTSGGPRARLVAELASRNRLLCLVRNAPAGVVARELAAVARHPEGASRGRLARSLPRAVGSRLALSRIRDESRRAVWDRWAGADETWPVPDVGQVA